MSISCMENLSNEIFYEIFDYLDGRDISNGFSKLNYRFQQFIDSPSVLFKIKIDKPSNEEFLNQCKQISAIHTHKILSLNVLCLSSDMDKYLSTYFIKSSFNRLESITLDYIEEDILILLLQNFISFPSLQTLNIHIYDTLIGLSDIYQLIFALPLLKSVKISGNDWIDLESLPIATQNEQSSQIKYFFIEHHCTFDQLAILTSYTPRLSHLEFNQELEDISDMEMISSIPFDNLTHLSMYLTLFDYDQFLVWIKKISSKLTVFNLNIRDDRSICLGSDPWERLISQHIPQLKKFSLTLHEMIYDDDEFRMEDYPWDDNQFTSSFWTERQLHFQARINKHQIIYSINRSKKTWYDSIDIDTNCTTSMEQQLHCTSAKLLIDHQDFSDSEEFLYVNIGWITNVTRIYHLELSKQGICIRILINLLVFLPDLNSLKLWSLLFTGPKRLSKAAVEFNNDIKNKNRITKVYIENLIKLREIFFLLKLFPHMKYLEISCTNDIDIQLFIQTSLSTILKKSNHDLCSLGFSSKMTDDQMVEKLKNIIDSKKLLLDYTIKRVGEKIYLKWK